MNPYRIYLRGELRKLSDPNEAAKVANQIPPDAIQNCGLSNDSVQLTSIFNSQDKVDAFVAGLNSEQSQLLTKGCDECWRKNGVYRKIQTSNEWVESEVGIDLIDVQQAEKELRPLFERNGWQLSRIVQDPELLHHKPYNSFDPSRPVEFPVCMALLKENGRYQVFDGIHRAIQMARIGQLTIRIAHPATNPK